MFTIYLQLITSITVCVMTLGPPSAMLIVLACICVSASGFIFKELYDLEDEICTPIQSYKQRESIRGIAERHALNIKNYY